MKKINYNNLDQPIYYFKHKSGLRIYVLPYKEKNNFYAILGTKYGSLDVSFYMDDKKITTPYGTAHFLEHKMYEQENGEDPFSVFAKTGISSNASTSFDNTRYYIWGVNEPLKNINYLLDFVFSPYFTEENVSKEKGIIKEEILMYEDNPEWALDDTSRKNMFYNLPVKEKISGTVENIDEITKENLYDAYNTFYNPSNMYLVVGGNIKPEEIESLLKNNAKLNNLKALKNIKREIYQEPDDVKEEFQELTLNVQIPKVRYSIKINKTNYDYLDNLELNMYLGIIMNHLFGPTSLFKEKVLTENLASGFYFEKNNYLNFVTLDITAESDKADIFISLIDKTLDNIKIKEEDLERIKKVWIASEVRMIDNLEVTVDNVYSDLINYQEVYPDRIALIRSLDLKKLKRLIKDLDLSNKTLVMVLPKEEM